MSFAFPPLRQARYSGGFVLLVLWSIATLLSSAQIYFREVARGPGVSWPEVIVANVVAWLPWLVITPIAIRLERRFPIVGQRGSTHVLLHTLSAAVASLTFLFYLAVFHAAFLDGHGFPPSAAVLVSEYTDRLGQHFLVALGLYGTILVTGFAHRTWISNYSGATTVPAPAHETDAPAAEPRLVVRSAGQTVRVATADIVWIESWGNYARLHTGQGKILIRQTLASLAAKLEVSGFVRVHRSAIVNVAQVARIRTTTHGDGVVELVGGQEVKVSRTHRRLLEERTR